MAWEVTSPTSGQTRVMDSEEKARYYASIGYTVKQIAAPKPQKRQQPQPAKQPGDIIGLNVPAPQEQPRDSVIGFKSELSGLAQDLQDKGAKGISQDAENFVKGVFDKGLTQNRRKLLEWHDKFMRDNNGIPPTAEDFENYFARKMEETEGNLLPYLKAKHFPIALARTVLPYSSEAFYKDESLPAIIGAGAIDVGSNIVSPTRAVRGASQVIGLNSKIKRLGAASSARTSKGVLGNVFKGGVEGAADNLAWTAIGDGLTDHDADASEYGLSAVIGMGVGAAHKATTDARQIKDYKNKVKELQGTSAKKENDTERAFKATGLGDEDIGTREKLYKVFDNEFNQHNILATPSDVENRLSKELADLGRKKGDLKSGTASADAAFAGEGYGNDIDFITDITERIKHDVGLEKTGKFAEKRKKYGDRLEQFIIDNAESFNTPWGLDELRQNIHASLSEASAGGYKTFSELDGIDLRVMNDVYHWLSRHINAGDIYPENAVAGNVLLKEIGKANMDYSNKKAVLSVIEDIMTNSKFSALADLNPLFFNKKGSAARVNLIRNPDSNPIAPKRMLAMNLGKDVVSSVRETNKEAVPEGKKLDEAYKNAVMLAHSQNLKPGTKKFDDFVNYHMKTALESEYVPFETVGYVTQKKGEK